MRRVGDEALLPVYVGGDLVEQPVDRDGEPVELVAGAAHRQAVAQSGRSQPLGGGEDGGHRPGGPAGQPVARQRCEQREGDAHRDQHPHQRLDMLFQRFGRHSDPDVEGPPVGRVDRQPGVAVGTHLDDILPPIRPGRREGGDRIGAEFALPDRLAILGEQMREPGPLGVGLRPPLQFGDDGVDVGVEVGDRHRDLADRAQQDGVGFAVQGRPHPEPHRQQRRGGGEQDDARVPERQPAPQARPRRRINRAPTHSPAPGRCGSTTARAACRSCPAAG